jgi:hypothetical protein
MRNSSFAAACTVLAVSMLACGCGAPNPSEGCIPVSLTVTYKGQPVEGAQVTFSAAGEGARTCQGTTDQSGIAVIGTFGTDDGAMPGPYQVSVSKATNKGELAGMGDPAMIDNNKNNTGDPSKGGGPGMGSADPTKAYLSQMKGEGGFKESESALPSKYANIDSSGLKFTVQGPGANDFKADLKD